MLHNVVAFIKLCLNAKQPYVCLSLVRTREHRKSYVRLRSSSGPRLESRRQRLALLIALTYYKSRIQEYVSIVSDGHAGGGVASPRTHLQAERRLSAAVAGRQLTQRTVVLPGSVRNSSRVSNAACVKQLSATLSSKGGKFFDRFARTPDGRSPSAGLIVYKTSGNKSPNLDESAELGGK